MTAFLMCLLLFSVLPGGKAANQFLLWLLPQLDALDAQPITAKDTQMVRVGDGKWMMI